MLILEQFVNFVEDFFFSGFAFAFYCKLPETKAPLPKKFFCHDFLTQSLLRTIRNLCCVRRKIFFEENYLDDKFLSSATCRKRWSATSYITLYWLFSFSELEELSQQLVGTVTFHHVWNQLCRCSKSPVILPLLCDHKPPYIVTHNVWVMSGLARNNSVGRGNVLIWRINRPQKIHIH